MKVLRLTVWTVTSLFLLMLTACDGGGGGGSDVSSPTSSEGASFGTLSMNITDAKPVLPDGVVNVWITFEEVLAHASGEGWISLPLAQTPYTIDLTQFYSGKTTELVPPVSLESGKYTQIRIVVSEAMIGIDDDEDNVVDYQEPVTIPSGSLKTDKNFPFEVEGGGAVHLTVDFDLSQSIVVTGQQPPTYELKPVLHINETDTAATIYGEISEQIFTDCSSTKAIATLYTSNGEIYTQVEVDKVDEIDEVDNEPAEFSMFWLVPEEDYIIEVEMGEDCTNSPGDPELEKPELEGTVSSDDLLEGVDVEVTLSPPV
jgi:hypothetical protein